MPEPEVLPRYEGPAEYQLQEWWPPAEFIATPTGWSPNEYGREMRRVDDDYGWFTVGVTGDLEVAFDRWRRLCAQDPVSYRILVVTDDRARRTFTPLPRRQRPMTYPQQNPDQLAAEPAVPAPARPIRQGMYDRYGGQSTVKSVVERSYGLMLADPVLAPIFAGVDLERVKSHQVAVITIAMRATGRDLAAAHAALGLGPDPAEHMAELARKLKEWHARIRWTDGSGREWLGLHEDHLAHVAACIRAALLEHGVHEADADELVATLAAFKDAVVVHYRDETAPADL